MVSTFLGLPRFRFVAVVSATASGAGALVVGVAGFFAGAGFFVLFATGFLAAAFFAGVFLAGAFFAGDLAAGLGAAFLPVFAGAFLAGVFLGLAFFLGAAAVFFIGVQGGFVHAGGDGLLLLPEMASLDGLQAFVELDTWLVLGLQSCDSVEDVLFVWVFSEVLRVVPGRPDAFTDFHKGLP
jgi:hypothetical protein